MALDLIIYFLSTYSVGYFYTFSGYLTFFICASMDGLISGHRILSASGAISDMALLIRCPVSLSFIRFSKLFYKIYSL